uniref:Integrase catalytic domain-containing protein n=1 Tax=Tanacetum cinerariifolium TaxID=118510 RepID=A0A6L2NC30_TANCI|nr:hypothetical protein [Tanacetum cinerariifolium]
MTLLNPQRHVVPTSVLTQSMLVPITAVRPVTTTVPKPAMPRPRPAQPIFTKPHSPPRRHIDRSPSLKASNFPPKVTAVKAPIVNAVKKLNGGYVAFGGNPKGGKISGKFKIRIAKLDFDDVYFVQELKFNLLSVSQMGDKKNNVLFTDTECLVLSPDFKLPDENQVLLKVHRENNMYNVDLKNIVPSGDLTCFFEKATLDESNLWHRRLGHINFKKMNKLVKGNLVRGLPTKVFETDHTCVACKKGKQHKASCKTKLVSSVNQPLQRLHMDLFGPTFVKSLNKKSYCLVVIDDYSRMKGIKREFSVPRTPQQNSIVERKNRTLIEAARTMLADLLLPIPFWAEAVNTACYVQKRVLVTKPQNKTLYELLHGRTPNKGVIDSGCSRNMTGNMSYLSDFKKLNGGYVAFEGNPKGGKISRKGKIRTGKLDFDDVYFVKELKFNLFSVSQMCDKKNSVLFTDIECLVLSPEFKLPNENQVLLRVPREKNMYNVNLKNIVPSGDLTCLFEKATIDESNLWHRRLGHINFKTINKLVKGNLVRGLPTKVFENDNTCVACKKGQMATGKENSNPFMAATQTRRMTRVAQDQGGLSQINNDDFHTSYASFMGFMVYQMDVKSAFLYGTIKEEVYVCQPPRFEDPDYPGKVYKVVKELYGLHQARRACMKSLKRMLHVINILSAGSLTTPQMVLYSPCLTHIKNWLVQIKRSLDVDIEPSELQKVVEVVTTAKLITEVVIADSATITAAAPQLTTTAAPTLTTAPSAARRRKGVVIRDPKESSTPFTIIQTEAKSKDNGTATGVNTPRSDEDRLKLIESMVFLLNKGVCDEFRFNAARLSKLLLSRKLKRSGDVTKLQALVDKKRIVITKEVIREILQLNDAEGVICLPNEEIFAGLAGMGYEKPSTKLTFYKAFLSTQWKFFIHMILYSLSAKRTSWNKFSFAMASALICLSTGLGKVSQGLRHLFLRVCLQLGMIFEEVEAQVLAQGDDVQEPAAEEVATDVVPPTPTSPSPSSPVIPSLPSHQPPCPPQPQDAEGLSLLFQRVLDTCSALALRVEGLKNDKAAQQLEIVKLKARVKKLEKINKVKSSKLRRLKKVGTSQRVESSDDVENVFNQGRIIVDMDQDEGIKLVTAQEKDAEVKGRHADKQANIYNIDLDHSSKVLSMQEDDTEVQEAVEVVTTAKLMTEVVTAAATTQVAAAGTPIPAAKPKTLTITAAHAVSTTRRKGVVIRDPEEELPSDTPAETPKVKGKGKGILIEAPKPMKKKDQIEMDAEYARKLQEEINKEHEEAYKKY